MNKEHSMNKDQKKEGCTDEECKTCDNAGCPDSPKYEEHEPNVLKFMVEHSWRTIRHVGESIVNVIRAIGILISAPWGIPYAGLVYNEMQQIYFEQIKKKKIPYMQAPSFMMKDAVMGVSRNKKLQKTISSRIRTNNGGTFMFYVKMFFAPFHYTTKCVKEKTALVRETMTYNETVMDEYKTEDGNIDGEKMGKVTMEIMELFARTFITGEQQNEES